MKATPEQHRQHLDEGDCRCHDSWDQCPCVEGGHVPGCNCCPLGTGLCGPKSAADQFARLVSGGFGGYYVIQCDTCRKVLGDPHGYAYDDFFYRRRRAEAQRIADAHNYERHGARS